MSNAEYLAALGIGPMSAVEIAAAAARDKRIAGRWLIEIEPDIVRHPTFWQRFKLLAVPTLELAVPKEADLPPAASLARWRARQAAW